MLSLLSVLKFLGKQ